MPGEHTFQVAAVLPIGIPDQSPALHEWTVDVPPDTRIDSSPPTRTTNPIAFFTFSGNEPNLDFECSLDGVAFSGCGEFTEFTDLLPGLHELRVRAVDGVGNVDPTPAVFVWRIGPAGRHGDPVRSGRGVAPARRRPSS